LRDIVFKTFSAVRNRFK